VREIIGDSLAQIDDLKARVKAIEAKVLSA
jgi:hypothetical protein